MNAIDPDPGIIYAYDDGNSEFPALLEIGDGHRLDLAYPDTAEIHWRSHLKPFYITLKKKNKACTLMR
jgi:hypothetical protein